MIPPRLAAGLATAAGAVVLVLALGVDEAGAASQMFKCIVGNRTVYQQQGCPVDAEPAASSAARAASASAKATTGAAAASPSRKVKPASRAASVPAMPR